MGRPFSMLRAKLKEKDIDNEYLAKQLNRSAAYISSRLNARGSWTQDEQYAILDILNLPDDDLPLLFPRGGRGGKGAEILGTKNNTPGNGQDLLLGLANAIMQTYGPKE